jgi:hypothetical protein
MIFAASWGPGQRACDRNGQDRRNGPEEKDDLALSVLPSAEANPELPQAQ